MCVCGGGGGGGEEAFICSGELCYVLELSPYCYNHRHFKWFIWDMQGKHMLM